jgi:type IV pilus assembly protein PilB
MSPVTVATRRRIGEVLVELGIVTEDQIAAALYIQRTTGKRLGEVLLEERMVEPRDLVRALAVQFGLPFVDLDEHAIDSELAQLVPRHLASRHRAVPVWRDEDSQIVVAMVNPVDVLALDDIRSLVGQQVKPVMAEGAQILAVVERLGHSDSRVQETIRAAVGENRRTDETTAPPTVEESVDEKAPIVKFIDLLLAKAIEERASDVHVEPTADDLRIRFRVDGVLQDALAPPRSLQAGIISRIKVMADLDIAERRVPQDGRITAISGGVGHDIRVVTIPTIHGEAAVLRVLSSSGPTVNIDHLGFLPRQLEQYRQAFKRPWGAILVTGPTGSGKTTTLYATLQELRDPTRNIITIEDPVENRIDGIKQVQVNERSGMTFPRALRSFLRADPDILLVGEIRDRDTAKIAVEASLTGHLVLTTLHTNTSSSAPMRLIDMGVEPFLVASSITAVLAQRLARRLCDKCKEPKEIRLDRMGLDEVSLAALPDDLKAKERFTSYQTVGCESCRGTGYRGRFAIHEVMTVTDEIAQLILHQTRAEEVERVAVEQGMSTLRADGLRKVHQGLTTVEELLRVIT